MRRRALIVVDWEKEWTDIKSDYFVGDLVKETKKMNRLISFCRGVGYRIIFIKHVERDSDGAFMEGSKNVECIDGLDCRDSDIVVTKYKISPFFKTNLDAELKGVTKIVVAGILTNLCVRSTVQDAYDRDFEITVIKDCCTAFNADIHTFTIQDIKATRDEIEFLTLKEFIK